MPKASRFFRIFLVSILSLVVACSPTQLDNALTRGGLIVGAERPDLLLPKLAGKKLGLIVNQSSLVRSEHLVDYLIASDMTINTLFAVEHGIRGTADAGEHISNAVDKATGLPIYSLYGKQKQPTGQDLKNIDLLIFDLQDVGVRFFTYLSSLHYVMQSCADTDTPLIILDRPNPNGAFIDGPTIEPAHTSFVGMHPIPLLHGMTLGELGRMINGEGWLKGDETCDLTIIPIANYNRHMPYELPIRPSPNLPNAQAIQLYPSIALFEATHISVGRGTTFPFQVLGGVKPSYGDFTFTPISMPGAAKAPKHMDIAMYGEDLRLSEMHGLDISKFIEWHQKLKAQNIELISNPLWLSKLMGTDKFLTQIRAGLCSQEIKKTWGPGLAKFKNDRQKYLLYPE